MSRAAHFDPARRRTIDDVLAEARARLVRLSP